jgi:predicted  nucleic acid-binding Zn-ribbon protein
MHVDLPRVRELQQVDDRIRELDDEIGRLPIYISDIERQLESHKKQIEADQAALVENKKSHRALEAEIATHQQHVTRLRSQMNEAKTNEQFRAFQHEIDFHEDAVRKVEDRILDKMVEAESLGQNVKKAEAALRIESEKVQREVAETKARVSKDEEEAAGVRGTRAELAKAISSQVLRTYEHVRKSRGGRAVARANAERCLACNVVFRPQFSQLLRSNEQVLTCEACGRILYYEPPGIGAEEVPSEPGETRRVAE